MIFALAIALTACAHYSLVEPERQAIGDLYTVEPQIAWSEATEGNVVVWTVDGPSLEAVRFVEGLEDGDVLFKVKDSEELPKFQKHMTASEIMEFVVDSMVAAGASRVDAINLRPAKFGELEGFRFDLAFLTAEGLEHQGLVVGVVSDERLHLIMYTGVRTHYYPKYKDQVERLIASIRT